MLHTSRTTPTSTVDEKRRTQIMSVKRLGKLEQLAGKRADQSRARLAQEEQALRQLQSYHTELRSINAEYQQATVGNESVTPQSLAHRRAFVSQLALKLDELSIQKAQKLETVEQRAHEHQQHAAQHAAIDTVHKQRVKQRGQSLARREQQQFDESAGRQYVQNQILSTERDNE